MRKIGVAVAGLLAVALFTVTANQPANADVADGTFQLVNFGSGKCVEVVADDTGNSFADGNRIWQRTCDGSPAQRWRITLIRFHGLLAYHVVNAYTNRCLDVKDGKTTDRAIVQQWVCNPDSSSMVWFPGESTTEYLSFTNWRSGKCLDVDGGSLGDFVMLQQYGCTHLNTAQEFSRIYN